VQQAGMDYLREGDKVTFDIVDNRGKPVADNLRVK
jgi:cold shock CspA family protein